MAETVRVELVTTDTQAHAEVRTDFLAHGLDHFQTETHAVFETAAKLPKMFGKHLVSVGLQMRCFGATEALLTLTKQMKIDQCERVRVN